MGLGYMSKASVCDVDVLGTGSSLAPRFEYLPSNGVWGAGYLQAGLSVFAWNYKQWEGSIDWDVGTDGALKSAVAWAITNRDKEEKLHAEPGGHYTMEIEGYNSSLSVSTSAGSLVSASAGAMCIGDKGTIDGSGGGPAPADMNTSNAKWCKPNDVLPYWQTSANLSSGGSDCGAIEWNVSITNSLVPILCCRGGSGEGFYPDDPTIFLGPTEAEASVTMYDGNMGGLDFTSRSHTVTIKVGSDVTITVKGIITGISGGIQTGDAIVGMGVTVKAVTCSEKGISA